MKNHNRKDSGFINIIFLILMGAVVGGLALTSKYIETKDIKPETAKETITATPSPIEIPETTPSVTPRQTAKTTAAKPTDIQCIGPDGKQFATTMDNCVQLNQQWGKPVDYMENCRVNTSCGGGTKYIKKSECDDSTCCQIGDKWYFYSSRQKCKDDQGKYNANNAVYPVITPYPTYTVPNYAPSTPHPTSAPVNNAELRDECLGNVQSKYQSELSRIRSQARASGSSTSAAEYLLAKEVLRDEQDCKSRYPVN